MAMTVDAGPCGPASVISEAGGDSMPKQRRKPFGRHVRWLRVAGARLKGAARLGWRASFQWRHPIPIEVLIADANRRRTLERELRSGLRRLQRALGAPLPADLAVVVQQVI